VRPRTHFRRPALHRAFSLVELNRVLAASRAISGALSQLTRWPGPAEGAGAMLRFPGLSIARPTYEQPPVPRNFPARLSAEGDPSPHHQRARGHHRPRAHERHLHSRSAREQAPCEDHHLESQRHGVRPGERQQDPGERSGRDPGDAAIRRRAPVRAGEMQPRPGRDVGSGRERLGPGGTDAEFRSAYRASSWTR
jgi:hypothetical protein